MAVADVDGMHNQGTVDDVGTGRDPAGQDLAGQDLAGQDGLTLGGDAEGVVCLALRGDIDLDTADHLKSTLLRAVRGGDAAGGPPVAPVALVLDLSGVSHLDSAGFAALVDAHRAATEAGCRLVLCCLQGQVARALRITNLDRYLHIAPSVAEARAAGLGGAGSAA